ncbi:helix-turn-helix transcriptional regulator [bacterium]|nr:helix-turn-helix transcriptional regulator [bacterium]
MNKASLQTKLGSLIRSKREAAGLTQEELAHLAGIHRTYLSILERGKRMPTVEVVRLLAKALKTTMTALVAELEGVTLHPPAPSEPS